MWRRIKKLFRWVFVAFVLFAAFMVYDGWWAFGKGAEGIRLERMQSSMQWNKEGEVFENPAPLWNDPVGMLTGYWDRSEFTTPDAELPLVKPEAEFFEEKPESGLRVTWLGHSMLLIEIDGLVVLTDPVWGQRVSPWSWVGPERWYPPVIALEDLPHVDVVLISHDHHDHLDPTTIEQIKDWDTQFVFPLGVGAHLEYWGVDPNKMVELDWWDEHQIKALRLVMTPARHASGRHLFDQNHTLWAGYALITEKHRVFFSGDTGLFPELKDIGDKFGPFDLTMIEVGAYNRAWPDWHMGPEQAIKAHELLRGKRLLPIHWGLFTLAYHSWTEPMDRTLVEAKKKNALVFTPKPGQSIEPTVDSPLVNRWWPEVSGETAEQHPIQARGITLP